VYREAAGLLKTEFGMTERRACRVLGFDRSTCRYRSRRPAASPALLACLHRHAAEWTSMGYHNLHRLVRADGFVINHKRFFRIYKAENLRIPRRRRRRKFCGPRQRMTLPERVNQRWSMDFVSDQLALGRRFRTLNIVDDKSRECLSIEVGTSLTGTQVVRVLDRLVQLRGRPEVIVMDNGPEFTARVLADWSMKMGVRLHFIRPGKPTENAFAESFNSIFRRECLNENWFLDMADARATVEAWRNRYNDRRPHGSLGRISPTEYSRQLGLAQQVEE
jgi:putative transposase